MSGMVDPCPWCSSLEISWTIPAYSRTGRPNCEDCGATGPVFFVEPGPRDHDKITGQAIAAWRWK